MLRWVRDEQSAKRLRCDIVYRYTGFIVLLSLALSLTTYGVLGVIMANPHSQAVAVFPHPTHCGIDMDHFKKLRFGMN